METTPTTTTASEPIGVFSFLVRLVVRPARAFEALVEGRTRGWLLVMGLVLILGVIAILVAAPVMQREIIEQMRAVRSEIIQVEPGPRSGKEPAPTPPPIPEEAISFATNPMFTVVFPAITMVGGTFVGWLLWAGILHLLAVFLGGRNTFGTMFKVVVAAALPDGIRTLLQAVYIASTQTLVIYSGLSGLVVPERVTRSMELTQQLMRLPLSRQILFHFLSKVDVFTVWHLFLLGTGVWTLTKFSRRKAYLLVLGVWLLATLVSMIPPLISSMLAGGLMGPM